ncbi:MAG: glycosyltransferase family 39 protein [Rhodocyclaceae bacterium]|nr:glycosyltransferase family 39 protein [Rhodocyclaceae bacterium]MBX3666786.1 glycosyltransferase family 39 protein [Rhodocyclaceae bacterium]
MKAASTPSAAALARLFAICALLLTAFRLWMAAVTPITGDEAYFIWWGKIPDWGFYDHPPMIGWWLAALLEVSEAAWWLRLPLVVQPALLGLMVALALRRQDVHAAWAAALFTMLAPATVWNVFITTDTPLIYFCVGATLAFARALERDQFAWYGLAGILLGGALLSKYFAGMLALAFAAAVLLQPTAKRLAGLLLVALLSAALFATNLWWNWDHCWANFMFNLINRHDQSGFSWGTPPLYVVMMAYLLTPPLLWQAWRGRTQIAALVAQAPGRAYACAVALPLTLFALMSPVKTIGMHWVLSFLPPLFILCALALPREKLTGLLRFFIGFALLHIVLIIAIAANPVERWAKSRHYDGIVLTVKADDLLRHLEPYRDWLWATDGYSPAVTLSYNARRYFFVFGAASSHARHDDILTDFRSMDGKNIAMLLKSKPDLGKITPYFERTEVQDFEEHGARFWIVLGHAFRYADYREAVLDPARRHWYAIPHWLPRGRCYFCERYFPDRACRKEN